MGIARHGQNRLDAALAVYLSLLARQPRPACFEDALLQYGLASLELGLGRHWLALLDRLLPGGEADLSPRLLYTRGLARLALGDYAGGWADYEHRFAAGCSQVPDLSQPLPLWQGETPPVGSHLLLLGEQGYGDILQVLRFAPLLRNRFAQVSLLVPAPLRRLARASGLFDAVVGSADPRPTGVSHALPLLSIPHLLQLHHPALFRPEPYLAPEPEAAGLWRRRLQQGPGQRPSPPLLAIHWQGNREGESPLSSHRERSLALADLAALPRLRRARLISVQVGPAASALRGSALEAALVPAQAQFDAERADFHTSAAVLAACDLLITNDTAVAHLGGALGLPTWLLLKCHPSWQWGDQGASNPWYRSLRSFRQHRPFDWSGVLGELDQALASVLGE